MAEPAAIALSRLFSTLLNTAVMFKPSSAAQETKAKKACAVYKVSSKNTALVVKADLGLLGAFAGALVGLPNSEVRQRLNANPQDELLRDPMNEVLNVAAGAVTPGVRAVFEKLVFNPIYLDDDAQKALNTPMRQTCFHVEVEGYQGGSFSILE